MKFSIITPVKNEEKYIGRLIDSVLSQNEDVEILIFDNCSEDNTLNIVGSYLNPKIKIYSMIQGGVHQLCEMGVRDSMGDIISVFGGDDFFLPNVFKKVKEVIGDSLVVGRVIREDGIISSLDSPENVVGQGIFWSKVFREKHNLTYEWQEYPNICDYILRKKAWDIESPKIINDVIAFANLSEMTINNKKERYLELKKFRGL